MKILQKAILALIITTAVLAPSAPIVSASANTETLPPLPEWPIIGPLLRRFGVAPPEPEPTPMPAPDPALEEYRISTLEDLQALEEIEPNTPVRIIATDEDLNQMALEVLQDADIVEDASLDLDFDPGLVTIDMMVSSALLNQLELDVEIPAALRGRNIDASATMGIQAVGCSINVTFDKVRVNRWRLGLRPIATRMVNERIPDLWSSDVCVEGVYLMDGEAAVEGYRR